GADQRNGLAWLCVEGQVLYGRELAVIGEGDAVEGYLAAPLFERNPVLAVLHRRRGVEHAEEFLEPRHVHKDGIDEARSLLEALDQHAGETHEHDDAADRGLALR